jgi:hypothetical protein
MSLYLSTSTECTWEFVSTNFSGGERRASKVTFNAHLAATTRQVIRYRDDGVVGRPGLDGPSPVAANAEGRFWGHRTRVEAEMCIALIHPVALLFTANQSHIPHILP